MTKDINDFTWVTGEVIRGAYMEGDSTVIYKNKKGHKPGLKNVCWRFSEQLGETSGYIHLV